VARGEKQKELTNKPLLLTISELPEETKKEKI
jgi:hypothetical protein